MNKYFVLLAIYLKLKNFGFEELDITINEK